MATSFRRFGRRLVGSISRNNFSTSCEKQLIQQQDGGGKSLNLYSAINQALHIALETDPRCVFYFTRMGYWVL